ncbi:hypothetical protein [Flavobacterium sp. 83]|uniref:hypothetical protein n=1 Tax=Flavobacterium sp. 83 TaxID=1131812 RepID=UPI0005595F28|nr:hypothetical protein [Flavobacterium sp. 83]
MNDPCKLYKHQYSKAKETLDTLEQQKATINRNLIANPICSDLHKELRNVTLDIKITMNEVEQAEFDINKCESKFNTLKTEDSLSK